MSMNFESNPGSETVPLGAVYSENPTIRGSDCFVKKYSWLRIVKGVRLAVIPQKKVLSDLEGSLFLFNAQLRISVVPLS